MGIYSIYQAANSSASWELQKPLKEIFYIVEFVMRDFNYYSIDTATKEQLLLDNLISEL